VAELIVDTLRGTLGSDVVSVDPVTRRSHRRDYWLLSQLEDVDGAVVALPACVVRPRNVDDVVAVVNACRSSGAALVPYGLGSGVCGAIVAPEGSVVLDMSSMARVREVDTNNLVASFDAGVRGTDAEEAVGKAGLTLGHYPQSIGVSSVGGWIGPHRRNVLDDSQPSRVPRGAGVDTQPARGALRSGAGADARLRVLPLLRAAGVRQSPRRPDPV
jgi:hypothetical protein